MRRFRVFIAVLLGLLWLPATLHCGLEAVDLLQDHCEDGGEKACTSAGAGCATDSCQVVEEPGYRAEVDTLDLAPPSFVACACMICVGWTDPARGPEIQEAPPEGWDRSRVWVPAWAFDRRAAAPAQAPNTPIA